MRIIRYDALVVGSTLGALVAGSYLARAGLRVLLVEEEVHTKRPPLLREPFALTGLESGGPADLVLRELGISLLERRELGSDPLAFQLLLPRGARLDVGRGREALATELAAYGVAEASEALAWLERADELGDAVRLQLREGPGAAGEGGLAGRLAPLRRGAGPELPELPAVPPSLRAFAGAQAAALSRLEAPVDLVALALLLRGPRDGVSFAPHAGFGFLDLFRRRFLSLHGELRAAERFALVAEGNEVGIELARERIFARAMVIGVPRAPLVRAIEELAPAPRWLTGATPPLPAPRQVLRAETEALPVGMGGRVICAEAGTPWALTRSPDPSDSRIEWLVVSNPPGSEPAEARVAAIAPFSESRIVPIDSGPEPRWDLDGVDLRFPEPRASSALKRRPAIVAVGPELAPDLGIEGELMLARYGARRVAKALGK